MTHGFKLQVYASLQCHISAYFELIFSV